MTIPQLEAYRSSAAAQLRISPDLLWLPISGILLLSLLLALKRLVSVIANPINELARQAREGDSSGYAFQRKSKLKEEDDLKHFLESQNLRVSEIEQNLTETEAELGKTKNELETSKSIGERHAQEISDLTQSQKELRVENLSLAASNEVLETSLETERKTKVGREVKMRAEEIYAQMERAVSNASARSIWIPNFISKLKSPTSVINNLSKRLESAWNETSLARLGEELAEIHRQSEIQLSLLEDITPDDVLPTIEPIDTEEEEDDKPAAPIEETQTRDTEIVLAAEHVSETQNQDEPAEDEEPESQPEAIEPQIQPEPAETAPALKLHLPDPVVEQSETEKSPDPVEEEEEPAAIEAEAEIVESEPTPQPESPMPDATKLSALQTLVFELVNDYSKEVENVSVDADFKDDIDVEIDEELLESVLSNLLEIAIYQWKEGSVKLSVSQKDKQITFAVDSKGKPLAYGELNESQTNRIESALDRNIDVDMPSESELRMRYKYVHQN